MYNGYCCNQPVTRHRIPFFALTRSVVYLNEIKEIIKVLFTLCIYLR